MKNCLNTWDMKFQSGFDMNDKLYIAIMNPDWYDFSTLQTSDVMGVL